MHVCSAGAGGPVPSCVRPCGILRCRIIERVEMAQDSRRACTQVTPVTARATVKAVSLPVPRKKATRSDQNFCKPFLFCYPPHFRVISRFAELTLELRRVSSGGMRGGLGASPRCAYARSGMRRRQPCHLQAAARATRYTYKASCAPPKVPQKGTFGDLSTCTGHA